MILFGPIRHIHTHGYLTSSWNPQLQDMSFGATLAGHVNSNCHKARSKEPEKFMNVEHMSNNDIKAVYFPHVDSKVEVTHHS
ncbi:hypothetical protein BGY98DRAFT_979276 [Russula aff. rugulosa BPL654]|nr:hypothetical protein BGY98DRAFT_979276 [Russula aff. rugulosa BPL654]